MRFLIAIKDTTPESKNILHIGVKIANGFGADLSVIFVGKKSSAIIEGDVALARLSLSEWHIYHPGLEILKWAFESIKEFGFLSNDHTEFDPANLIEESGRIRMVLPQSSGEKIRLLLREGELLNELHKETQYRDYELAIIGNPFKKRMTHKLIQFLDTSVFIIKNINPTWNYKILLCVDDSAATKRAIIFGAIISRQFDAPIHAITVSKTKKFGKGYRNASRWVQKYLRMQKLPHTISMITGRPTEVFLREASTDHIIVMGKSTGGELKQFFKGSKPIHTAQKAKSPILLVKP
ncbi:MAG: universal stress protein [Candidatus Marinimicrobia bacterium]|nr:universal stress protein [Candidatus Neomarinimicrobiota bacterium]